MKEFCFSLLIENLDPSLKDEDVDKIFSSGCDDGLICSSDGKSYIHFTKKASTFVEAVEDAMERLEKCGFNSSFDKILS